MISQYGTQQNAGKSELALPPHKPSSESRAVCFKGHDINSEVSVSLDN